MIFKIDKYKPVITLPSFTNTNNLPLIGWKIYRSDLVVFGTNPSNYTSKLIEVVNFSQNTRIFIDDLLIPPIENTLNNTYQILKIQ